MKEYKTDNLNLFHMDNMELMKKYEDNHFDLAIVDPEYGIGISKNPVRQQHTKKDWDNSIPKKEYFDELFRVSKNQIIWGGNYFIDYLGNTQHFLIWDKVQPHDFSLAMCEMAWTSFSKPVKIFKQSVLKERNKIHVTQKPVELYKYQLRNYAICENCGGSGFVKSNNNDCDVKECSICKGGFKILDTNLGSGSIAVACENGIIIDNETVKFNLTGCELDEEYFDNMCKRIEAETQQLTLF